MLDRLVSPALLIVLAPFAAFIAALYPARLQDKRCVFLKLKGGGSLIIALPALLAIRRAMPDKKFILVCTDDTRIYAELTGIFDEYSIIRDKNLLTLLITGLLALKSAFRSCVCVDLEPSSLLAEVFCMLTVSRQRIGFVKPENPQRAKSYTDAIAFNVMAPVYQHYEQIAELLHAPRFGIDECHAHFDKNIFMSPPKNDITTIGIAAYTSDFAPERMMPIETWVQMLLSELDPRKSYQFLLFGSLKNKQQADQFMASASPYFPLAHFSNICGTYSLAQAAGYLRNVDQFWCVDSGLLHIARLLKVPCRSFWGPTHPRHRLQPIDGLEEKTFYQGFSCSPCVHLASPPCGGNNLCMKTMAEPNPNRSPVWKV